MAQRRLAYPQTMLQAQELIRRRQNTFGGGINSDIPASEIGPDELADIFNMISFPKYLRGRPGCKVLSSALPTITSYPDASDPSATSFDCSKTGKRVYLYVTDQQEYDQLIAGNYLVWPDGTWDQIGTIVEPGSGEAYFDSRIDGDQARTTAGTGYCRQSKRVWGAHYNKKTKNIIVHHGDKLRFTTNVFGAYKEVVAVGLPDDDEHIAESFTRFDSKNDQVTAYNANGVYRIIFDEDTGYYFKLNDGQPLCRIHENPNVAAKVYRRNRLYTGLRITGDGVLYGNRATPGVFVQQETAPVLPDSNHKDASVGYTDLPIGTGSIKYQELASGAGLLLDVLAGSPKWADYDDAAFDIEINDLGVHTIVFDSTDCATLIDLADAIQRPLRDYFPTAECFFRNVDDNPQIVITGGKTNGTTVSYITAGSSGTDVSSLLAMTNPGTPIGQLSTVSKDAPQLCYDLYAESFKQTHFGIYESEDFGVNGLALENLQDLLVWARDIPVIKTFRADRDADGVIVASNGEKLFYREDEGSHFAWADDRGIERIDALLNPADDTESTNECEAQASTDAMAGTLTKSAVPIVMGGKKVNIACQVGSTVYLGTTLIEAWNKFSAGDLGKILFLEDGSIRHILTVNVESNTCTVHEAEAFGTYADPSTWQAVAWDPIMRNQAALDGDNKLVVFDKPQGSVLAFVDRTGGHTFSASDEGKKIYLFKDGVFVTDVFVTVQAGGYQDENRVQIGWTGKSYFDAEWKGLYGIVTDYMPGRFFNDYISDEILASRESDPAEVLQTRFFRPLPSSNIGAIGQNFMFVYDTDENKVCYSELPNGREYIGGFYHLTWQVDTGIEDTVTMLKYYPGRMVAFCKQSTWTTNLDTFSSIVEESIGEKIFTIATFSLLDKIGLVHVHSVQDVAIGQSILMAANGSIMLFNGRQFLSSDLAAGKISKALRLWHTNVYSSYDAIWGYLIFGSPILSTDADNAVNPTDGDCYRLPVLPSQGSGWNRWGGEDMVWPMACTGGLNVDNAYDMPMQVMLDARTGKWHQINTYDGPDGSGLTESFVDKGDAEIICSFTGPEHKGSSEANMLEHMETHCFIRPKDTASVYRENFQVNTMIYKDGATVVSAKTENTPIDGDFVFDRKMNAKRLQNEMEFTTSAFMVVQIEMVYISRDTAGSTAMDKRDTSESSHQKAYGAGIVWLTRGRRPTLNRSVGVVASGSYAELVEGPDGISNSAMKFDGGEGLTVPLSQDLTGDFTIQFGYKE